jgi:putative hydrolase of HD superfamily
MDISAVLQTLLHGNQLKRTMRTGWVQRGVPNPESVAAHSYGVVFATLVLAQVMEESIDLSRALAIAALHDLPEGLTTDIPTPAWRYLPAGVKTAVERHAMQDILQDTPYSDSLMTLWEELHTGETAESRLVDDADKLDMFVQALVYEEQTGNRHLAEFWQRPYSFHYAITQAIYDQLRQHRENMTR